MPRGGAASSPADIQDLRQPLKLKEGFSNRADTYVISQENCRIYQITADASSLGDKITKKKIRFWLVSLTFIYLQLIIPKNSVISALV